MERNAVLKTRVVQSDEFEKGDRRLLNFGHTLGHALEKQYNLTHGEAVAIGMAFAARLSKGLAGFKQSSSLVSLIQQFELPVEADYNKKKIIQLIINDKKKEGGNINFVLLERIGKGVVRKISLEQLYKLL